MRKWSAVQYPGRLGGVGLLGNGDAIVWCHNINQLITREVDWVWECGQAWFPQMGFCRVSLLGGRFFFTYHYHSPELAQYSPYEICPRLYCPIEPTEPSWPFAHAMTCLTSLQLCDQWPKWPPWPSCRPQCWLSHGVAGASLGNQHGWDDLGPDRTPGDH